MAEKIIKSIPSTENGPDLHYKTLNGEEYLISQCVVRQRFTAWKKVGDGFVKLYTDSSPITLCERLEEESKKKRKK